MVPANIAERMDRLVRAVDSDFADDAAKLDDVATTAATFGCATSSGCAAAAAGEAVAAAGEATADTDKSGAQVCMSSKQARTLVAQIKELQQLHSCGALTDEEFAASKAKLLGLDKNE